MIKNLILAVVTLTTMGTIGNSSSRFKMNDFFGHGENYKEMGLYIGNEVLENKETALKLPDGFTLYGNSDGKTFTGSPYNSSTGLMQTVVYKIKSN